MVIQVVQFKKLEFKYFLGFTDLSWKFMFPIYKSGQSGQLPCQFKHKNVN